MASAKELETVEIAAERLENAVTDEAARVKSALSFFDYSRDRPGCYEKFLRTSRSPRQRFCSKPRRRALECVWERERRWRESRRQEGHTYQITY